ncbi:MAG: putative lipid II flippase FtsW [Gammaproteobacteria bacterium]|nr:putative lipid II flippase FtsW [Gammaproteobacteria bacterium]RZP03493.1 MAG: putative lipid II flippase FtsW [Gammaproteobacteria bacterium]|tara:strand:+ start:4544 stop:5713 length:1170 start_codon:yes stop_codon:yes gene_type:complete
MSRINFLENFDYLKLDYVLISLFFVISFCGLLILASASVHFSDSIYGNPSAVFNRQFFYFLLGVSGLLIFFLLPLSFWSNYDRVLLTLGFLLLLFVFVPGVGVEVNGANRWIRFAGFGLQPSEIMKFLSILYVSCYSVRRIKEIQSHWLGFFRPALIIVSIISVILIQPDLGSSAVIFISVLGVLFVAGVKIRQFLIVALLGLIGISLMIIFVPWRWERIISFIDPWSNPWGSGYQLTLSLMSIGRGDWFGVGLGEGLMKMGYLPDAHTDFIFSVIVEETGILGGLLIVSLLFGLSFRVFYIGRESLIRKNFFGFYFSYGVALLLGLHTFINVGVACGLLPTKGLTLPLISAGGTNLIIVCLMIGIILRVDYENKNSMPVPNFNRRAKF